MLINAKFKIMLQIYSKCFQSRGNSNSVLKRYTHQNYYEILHLSRKCSAKDIRNSFVYLTKKVCHEYHPDRTDNKSLHAQFIKIVEAYNILSKAESRKEYDRNLAQRNTEYASSRPTNSNIKYTYYNSKQSKGPNPWDDPIFWHNRKQKMEDYNHIPYYGINGFDKVPNTIVVFICCIVAGLGIALQIFAIRNSITLRRGKMKQVSNDAQENLRVLRQQVELNGNDVQIEIVKDRFLREEERQKQKLD